METHKPKLLHIVGEHEKTEKKADFYYVSIEQAAHYNPGYINFVVVGYEKDELKKHMKKKTTLHTLFRQRTNDDIKTGRQSTLSRWNK